MSVHHFLMAVEDFLLIRVRGAESVGTATPGPTFVPGNPPNPSRGGQVCQNVAVITETLQLLVRLNKELKMHEILNRGSQGEKESTSKMKSFLKPMETRELLGFGDASRVKPETSDRSSRIYPSDQTNQSSGLTLNLNLLLGSDWRKRSWLSTQRSWLNITKSWLNITKSWRNITKSWLSIYTLKDNIAIIHTSSLMKTFKTHNYPLSLRFLLNVCWLFLT